MLLAIRPWIGYIFPDREILTLLASKLTPIYTQYAQFAEYTPELRNGPLLG
jgi:hypothetical protein